MSIYYVNLYYNFSSEVERLFRTEFYTEGKSFNDAAAKTRKLMESAYPEEVGDKQYVTVIGWHLPGAQTQKRLS